MAFRVLVSMMVMRAQRRVIYESGAQATESGTPSAKQEFVRRSRIAAGAIQLLKRGFVPRISQPVLWFQFVSHKLLRWFSPILLIVLLVSNLWMLSQQSWYSLALTIQVIFYIAILATYLIPALRKTRLGAVAFYFGISQVAMSYGLARGLMNRQSSRWEKGQRAEAISGSNRRTT